MTDHAKSRAKPRAFPSLFVGDRRGGARRKSWSYPIERSDLDLEVSGHLLV